VEWIGKTTPCQPVHSAANASWFEALSFWRAVICPDGQLGSALVLSVELV
jgi:hypothetical protein